MTKRIRIVTIEKAKKDIMDTAAITYIPNVSSTKVVHETNGDVWYHIDHGNGEHCMWNMEYVNNISDIVYYKRQDEDGNDEIVNFKLKNQAV